MADANNHLSVTFECAACGGGVLSLPDDYTDDSIAVCKQCGASFGPYGDVKAKAIQAAKDRIGGDFRKLFKGD